MKSRKSAFFSIAQPAEKRRKPDSLRRSRLFKRGCDYEPLNTDNLRYVWVAYVRGVFDKVDNIPAGMTKDEFVFLFTELTRSLIRAGGDAFVLFGQSPKYGRIGMGIVTVARDNNKLYPHVAWFPEATMRNRLECAAKFLVDIKSTGNVLIYSIASEAGFFIHLGKYGILRRVGGTIRKYFPDGQDSILFQGVID